jgi:hypothetical protein
MGNVNAAAMAEAVGEGQVALRPALVWHLQANHYPPVPTTMVDPCIAAIDAAIEFYTDGDERSLEGMIDLPEGITWKGQPAAPAAAIIEQHHLWPFIENVLYGDEDYE